MSRRSTAWLVCLALMAVGGVLAHAAAYRLAAPAHGSHAGMNHPAGSSLFPHLTTCLAVALTVALVVVLLSALGRRGVTRRPSAPLWVFAVVPPLGFVLQEHVEHLLQIGTLPHGVVAEPTFLVGLVLQLPFALAAFAAARALLALAKVLARRLGAAPRPRVLAPPPHFLPAPAATSPRISALALGHGQRAPPAFPA